MRLIDADALIEECNNVIEEVGAGEVKEDYYDGYEAGVENIRDYAEYMPTIDAVPQWIPCSERLPEAPFGCLVTVEDEEPMTGALFPNLLPYFVGWDGEQWNDADGEQCPFEVLAWMPLPKPYEVEK